MTVIEYILCGTALLLIGLPAVFTSIAAWAFLIREIGLDRYKIRQLQKRLAERTAIIISLRKARNKTEKK